MKTKFTSFPRKAFLWFFFFAVVVSQAQTFPEFSNETPGGSIQVFRSSPLVGDYNDDGKLETLVLGRNDNGWAVRSFMLEYNGVELTQKNDWHHELGLENNEIYNPTIAWIDFDNNGELDLLLMGSKIDNISNSQSVNLLFNLYKNKNGIFQLVSNSGLSPVFIEQENMYGYAIAVADYDNDGYPDIMITGKVNDINKVSLYKNLNGTGTFEEQTSTNFENLNNGSICFGDFNKDGLVDVLYNGWGNNGKVKLYKNTGNGHFLDMNIDNVVTKGTQKGRVLWVDINSDGYLDFIVTGERNGTTSWTKHADLYINNGDETFSEAVFQTGLALTGISYGSVDAADLNGDGLVDLVIAGTDGSKSSALYLNQDVVNGEYGFEKQSNTFGALRSGANIQIVDYDGNGYLDVFSMGYGSELLDGSDVARLFIWKNTGNLSANHTPTAPTDLNAVYDNGVWTFTWNAGSDVETPSAALTYNLFVKKSATETMMIVPADVTSGSLKVSELNNALRTKSYTMKLPREEMEWGVQTIDQGKLASKFTVSRTSVVSASYKNTTEIDANVYASNGSIYIESNEPVNVTLYNLNGNCIATLKSVIGKRSVMLPLENGVYLVDIKTGKSKVVRKVIL